ncbi:hypothetical protein Tco_0169740 [Tanacetum coccineum]
MEILLDRENLMQSIETFLKKFDRISFREKPKDRPAFYDDDDDDDDDEESSIPLRDIIISGLPPCIAITPVLSTVEPVDSFIMENKHLDTIQECWGRVTRPGPLFRCDPIWGYYNLDTISATESDKLVKSSVENLVPIPSESEDFSDIESECDVPDCEDSQTTNFSTFSNPLFDGSTSSDDESSHEEVIHEMSFKTYLNPLFDLDEEIISSEFNLIHNENLDSTPKNDRFDTESYLLESLLNRDTLMASSPKNDSLFDDFTEDFHAILNTIIESLPTFSIPVEDSDSLREEINIFPGPDDSIPPGIESDDYDSEDDDDSTSLPEFESFHVDYPDSGDSTIDVVEDIPIETRFTIRGYALKSNPQDFLLLSLSPLIDTLLPFSSENKDKVFNHGVLASKEKSPPSLSHRGFKASKLFHQKSPMLIYGEGIPILDVPIAPDFEASRARGFVFRSLELQILSFIMGIQYPNLID